MRPAARSAMEMIEASLEGPGAADIGTRLMKALEPFGVRALYARVHPTSPSESEHVLARISPPGWESFYAEQRFAKVNYLTREVRRRASPFAWSDIALTDPAEVALARALKENGFPDGLAIPSHGPTGHVGVTSLAFERLWDISPDERAAIELAALVLHERMRILAPMPDRPRPRLTGRERDCLASVAEGRTDAEIAALIGVSETTVIAHLQSLRRKLHARNRAHAVALGMAAGII